MSWSPWTISKRTRAWCLVNTHIFVDDDDDDDYNDNDDDDDAVEMSEFEATFGCWRSSGPPTTPAAKLIWFKLKFNNHHDDDDGGADDDEDSDYDCNWQPNFRWKAALPHLLKKFFQQV